MNISYKINDLNHRVVFCHDKESPKIKRDLSKLYSDKKMMVIIDKNLGSKFTKYLQIEFCNKYFPKRNGYKRDECDWKKTLSF